MMGAMSLGRAASRSWGKRGTPLPSSASRKAPADTWSGFAFLQNWKASGSLEDRKLVVCCSSRGNSHGARSELSGRTVLAVPANSARAGPCPQG